ncbi:phosphoribosyl transferase domain protein [Mycobacterium kansasii]|uniref:Phosphoribosyl transferase domain protein n=1 Tax=Mycobacterium kansasii TaxID=1768 RepID=A0A1V3WXM2_MYCKA|nr:phosphoribosyl transferase domain protein [Mycobacterium kansasii]
MILVDDGLATGASMFAAVQALREAEPEQIVIAVPAARNPPAGSSPVWSMTSYAPPCPPRFWR